MERHKSDAANGGKMADSDANEPADGFDELAESQDELIATAATVAVVGAGVIISRPPCSPALCAASPRCWSRNICRGSAGP